MDGGNVNPTPFFVAEVKDKDGINAAGSGIGHDLQLIIDGDANKTYNLNNNFTYDFGTYTSGSTYYSIPELAAGPHKLQFRALGHTEQQFYHYVDFQCGEEYETIV